MKQYKLYVVSDDYLSKYISEVQYKILREDKLSVLPKLDYTLKEFIDLFEIYDISRKYLIVEEHPFKKILLELENYKCNDALRIKISSKMSSFINKLLEARNNIEKEDVVTLRFFEDFLRWMFSQPILENKTEYDEQMKRYTEQLWNICSDIDDFGIDKYYNQ